MKIHSLLLVVIVLFGTSTVLGQSPWRDIITAEDLYKNYPEMVESIFEHLDLDYPGLEKVAEHYNSDEVVQASEALLGYYKQSANIDFLRRILPAESSKTIASADTIITDVFTIQSVKGKVPYGADGHRDWRYRGPNNDDEWAWLSNRHHQIDNLLVAYFATGNPKYVIYIDAFLKDFIIKSNPYPAQSSWDGIWRGLEVSFRNKYWPRVFYSLINSEYMSEATQLLILSSLPDHAHYNRYYYAAANWLTMELSGLAAVTTTFPEYTFSAPYLDFAINKMTQSIAEQCYPDGVQIELTGHYHNVAFLNFEEFKKSCDKVGKVLPETFTTRLELMSDYVAKTMRPDGYGLLNNDGDKQNNREQLICSAKDYHRPDWLYIATNGIEGEQPEASSFFYPWAGQMISRSDYDKQAHWSFFDVGPWGSSHQHSDKLHLSIAAYGRDFLVDAGRFAYSGEIAERFRPYAQSSAGHNTVQIDGKMQMPGPKVLDEAIALSTYALTTGYDFACGRFDSYENLEGEAEHNRSVLYVKGAYWIVVDRIVSEQPRSVQTVWHWHPKCDVVVKHDVVKTQHEEGNLSIIPIGKHAHSINQLIGVEDSFPQGWYSYTYNSVERNLATVYTTEIETTKNLVWLVLPSQKQMPRVRAQIVSEDDKMVNLRVNVNGVVRDLTVPYNDKKYLKVEIK